uniref:Sodium/solute symporter n=1 Tax=Phlebotomus papatasi TaxID=29031 RepID=A0A1B0DA56_PHLPP
TFLITTIKLNTQIENFLIATLTSSVKTFHLLISLSKSTMKSNSSVLEFSILDYGLFNFVLIISILIGIYHGLLSKKKQNTLDEYFLGSRNMGVIPVATSLLVSFVSGNVIIGITADVYKHGTYHWHYVITMFMTILMTVYIIIPIFYELKLPSSFSYLKLRFGRKVQLLASFIFLMTTILSVSVAIYVPSLVFNHVAGVSITVTVVVLGCVCIFYTAIGGFRAVVWADMFQAIILMICCSAIVYIGYNIVGGFDNIWEASQRGHKLILFNFDPDPTVRLTTWGFIFGHSIILIQQVGMSQTSIQRFLSMSNISKVTVTFIILSFCFLFFLAFALITALVMYTYYETCDPLSSGLISQPDQILSQFVAEIGKNSWGLPGLFVAGIIAGSLSTMSSFLNSCTVCLYEDFLKPFLPQMSNKKTCTILKLLTVALGLLQISLVFVIQKLGTIFTIAFTILGVTLGTMFGLFTMGMFFRKANQTGAITGTISSLIGVSFILFGSLSRKPDKSRLLMRTDGCLHNITNTVAFANATLSDRLDNEDDDTPWIFRITFMYYSTIGFILVYLIGYPTSLLTGGNEVSDERLLAPFLRKKKLNPQDDEEVNPLSHETQT